MSCRRGRLVSRLQVEAIVDNSEWGGELWLDAASPLQPCRACPTVEVLTQPAIACDGGGLELGPFLSSRALVSSFFISCLKTELKQYPPQFSQDSNLHSQAAPL